MPRPATATLFPYTTLFRSPHQEIGQGHVLLAQVQEVELLEQALGQGGAGDRHLLEELDRGLLLRDVGARSEEHTSELQSHVNLVCRLLLEKKKAHFINLPT